MSESSLRYHPNPAPPLRKVPCAIAELRASLDMLLQGCPPVTPWPGTFFDGKDAGLFTGPSSIAVLFLHLSRSHASVEFAGKAPREWCAAYLACAQPSPSADLQASGCGITNAYLAYHAVSAALTQDLDSVSALVEAFFSDNPHINPASNEWMGGRAGALYLLRLVRAFVPSSADTVNPVMKSIIEHILAHKPWTWRDTPYIGAVHGDVGIMTQVVLSDPSYAAALEGDLAGLLELQTEDGNWPSKRSESHHSSHPVQFCHGAPGFVFSLEALRPHFPSALHSQIDAAIERGRQCVWEQGFLTKEPCLCHGATGNALALREEQREHLLALATPAEISKGLDDGTFDGGKYRDPWGMLWGEAGRAWSWAVLDSDRRGLALVGCLGYTDV